MKLRELNVEFTASLSVLRVTTRAAAGWERGGKGKSRSWRSSKRDAILEWNQFHSKWLFFSIDFVRLTLKPKFTTANFVAHKNEFYGNVIGRLCCCGERKFVKFWFSFHFFSSSHEEKKSSYIREEKRQTRKEKFVKFHFKFSPPPRLRFIGHLFSPFRLAVVRSTRRSIIFYLSRHSEWAQYGLGSRWRERERENIKNTHLPIYSINCWQNEGKLKSNSGWVEALLCFPRLRLICSNFSNLSPTSHPLRRCYRALKSDFHPPRESLEYFISFSFPSRLSGSNAWIERALRLELMTRS